MHAIYDALKETFSQECIVSHYYPYSYGKHWFYRYSELCSSYRFIKRHDFIRKIIRFLELVLALFRSFIFIVVNRVKIINYSLNSDLFIEYYFLKAVKNITKTKIAITCHDVLPFGVDVNNIEKTNAFKKKKHFFDLADFLIVHNKNSVRELNTYFKIDNTRIYIMPFPVMDIRMFLRENSLPANILKYKNHFVISMVGHFREEKGLDILLDAWEEVTKKLSDAYLIIMGHFPNKDLLKQYLNLKNAVIYDGFLNDNAYAEIIHLSDVVVLPYRRGTNSGIPSSIISMGTMILASNIEMFKNNQIISKDLLFNSGNASSLANKLVWIYSLSKDEKEDIIKNNIFLLKQYISSFKHDIIYAYNLMFEK